MKQELALEKVFFPSYVKAFACQQCGSCCLAKWSIDIDPKTYQRVQQRYASEGRQEEFAAMMQKAEKDKIRMNFVNGRCAALEENNLCLYQLQFGSEYLSDTCKVYPRKIIASPRGFELALVFSCTAAAACLKSQDRAVLEEAPVEAGVVSFMKPHEISYYIPKRLPETDVKHFYFLIEPELLQLIQNRSMPISKRILSVGQLLGQLEGLNGQADLAAKLQQLFQGAKTYKNMEPDYGLHVHCLQQIFSLKAKANQNVKNSLEFLFKALSLDVSQPWNVQLQTIRENPEKYAILPELYSQRMVQYYQPVLETSSHILENYFVNYVCRKEFYFEAWPFAFFKMAVLHAMIQFYTVAFRTVDRKATDEEALLRGIVETELNFAHSEAFMQEVWKSLEQVPAQERHKIVFNLARG